MFYRRRACAQREWIQLAYSATLLEGLVEPPQRPEVVPVQPCAGSVARVQLESPLEFLLRPRPIPVVNVEMAQRRMRFRQRFVQFHRSQRGRLGWPADVALRHDVIVVQPHVSFVERRIGGGVGRVLGNRLLLVFDCLADGVHRPLIVFVLTLEEQLVDLRLDGAPGRKLCFICRTDSDLDLPGDLTCHLTLQRKNVANVSFVGASPEMAVSWPVYQLSSDSNPVART